MQSTGINVPVRIGRAVVLPGDLVLAKQDGVIFIPATLAGAAINKAEFTNLQDGFNFELNSQGKNGASFEGGWTAEKFAALAKWVYAASGEIKDDACGVRRVAGAGHAAAHWWTALAWRYRKRPRSP